MMIFYKKSLFKPWNGWLNISYNFHFLLTLLVALTLPIDVRAQFCSFAIVLLFINWLFSGRYEKKLYYLKHSKEGLLMLLFFLLHLVALIYTGDLKEGFFDIEKKLALFIVPLVLISFPLNVSQRDFILACFIIFCVILSIIGFCYGLLHYQEVIKNKGPEHLVTYISNIHRVYFSIYLLLSYFLLFYFYRKYKFSNVPFLKICTIILALVIVFMIVVMASRIVLILFLVTTASILFYFFVIKKKQFILAGILAGVGCLLMFLVYNQVTHVRKFMNDLTQNFDRSKSGQATSVNLRIAKYESGIQAIKANWLTGVGTGDVQHELNKYYRINNFYDGYTSNLDAHNQYFQTWLGLGLPGLIIFLALLILPLIRGIKEFNYPLVFFIVTFLICSLTESLLTTQKGIIYLALFYPLLYCHRINQTVLYSRR